MYTHIRWLPQFSIIQQETGDYKKILNSLLNKCAGKEGAQQEDLKGISEMKEPTTEGGKCVLACLFEALQLVM